jgi:hypothetical protein
MRKDTADKTEDIAKLRAALSLISDSLQEALLEYQLSICNCMAEVLIRSYTACFPPVLIPAAVTCELAPLLDGAAQQLDVKHHSLDASGVLPRMQTVVSACMAAYHYQLQTHANRCWEQQVLSLVNAEKGSLAQWIAKGGVSAAGNIVSAEASAVVKMTWGYSATALCKDMAAGESMRAAMQDLLLELAPSLAAELGLEHAPAEASKLANEQESVAEQIMCTLAKKASVQCMGDGAEEGLAADVARAVMHAVNWGMCYAFETELWRTQSALRVLDVMVVVNKVQQPWLHETLLTAHIVGNTSDAGLHNVDILCEPWDHATIQQMLKANKAKTSTEIVSVLSADYVKTDAEMAHDIACFMYHISRDVITDLIAKKATRATFDNMQVATSLNLAPIHVFCGPTLRMDAHTWQMDCTSTTAVPVDSGNTCNSQTLSEAGMDVFLGCLARPASNEAMPKGDEPRLKGVTKGKLVQSKLLFDQLNARSES